MPARKRKRPQTTVYHFKKKKPRHPRITPRELEKLLEEVATMVLRHNSTIENMAKLQAQQTMAIAKAVMDIGDHKQMMTDIGRLLELDLSAKPAGSVKLRWLIDRINDLDSQLVSMKRKVDPPPVHFRFDGAVFCGAREFGGMQIARTESDVTCKKCLEVMVRTKVVSSEALGLDKPINDGKPVMVEPKPTDLIHNRHGEAGRPLCGKSQKLWLYAEHDHEVTCPDCLAAAELRLLPM